MIINTLPQLTTLHQNDRVISNEELDFCLNKMDPYKVPGPNGIPPSALKALFDTHRTPLFKLIKQYFTDQRADIQAWYVGNLTAVPKPGDQSNPNKRRGIALLDVLSKLLASVLNRRLLDMVKKFGLPTQFGSTTHTRCREGIFCLRSILHTCHHHNQDNLMIFVDLVKAFNMVLHAILSWVLAKYGIPPN